MLKSRFISRDTDRLAGKDAGEHSRIHHVPIAFHPSTEGMVGLEPDNVAGEPLFGGEVEALFKRNDGCLQSAQRFQRARESLHHRRFDGRKQ